jgi:outer membrane lipase/esterase
MMVHVRRYVWITALVASLLPASAWSTPFSSLIIFGDSLSDTGNNAAVFDTLVPPPGTLRTPVPISSPTFIPDYPYASNRYSNGPVWVEGLAAGLGLSAQASLLGGTDFAFGGARSGPSGSSFPYSLLDQVSFFLSGVGGIAPVGPLYVVAGGGNDARDAFALAAGGGDPSALISGFANDIVSIITELEAGGPRDILLADVPDIGKTPAIQAYGPVVAGIASGIAMDMNDALYAGLAGLAPTMTQGIRVLDLYGLLDQVFADPSAFGLTDAIHACAYDPACIADPSGTFFWDGIHPTAAGHAILAAAALRTVPEPGTALLVAIAALALLVSRHRQSKVRRIPLGVLMRT